MSKNASVIVEDEPLKVELEPTDKEITDDDKPKDEPEKKDEDEDEDIVSIQIGDEEPEENEEEIQKAPQWVKDLRKRNRELAKENKKLKEGGKTAEEDKPSAEDPGPKPTLKGCDYDDKKYEEELNSWHEKKRNADKAEADAKQAKDKEKEAWNRQVENYNQKKKSLKVKDFDDVEERVSEILSAPQIGMIVHGAENSAMVIYALGKNPTKAKELAKIDDHIKFAFAVSKMETTMKVKTRKVKTSPEETVETTGGAPKNFDQTLSKLRAKAEKTGDYTEVMAFKRKNKKK